MWNRYFLTDYAQDGLLSYTGTRWVPSLTFRRSQSGAQAICILCDKHPGQEKRREEYSALEPSEPSLKISHQIAGLSLVPRPATPDPSQRISFIKSFNQLILNFFLSCKQRFISLQFIRITIVCKSTAGHSVSQPELPADRRGRWQEQRWRVHPTWS